MKMKWMKGEKKIAKVFSFLHKKVVYKTKKKRRAHYLVWFIKSLVESAAVTVVVVVVVGVRQRELIKFNEVCCVYTHVVPCLSSLAYDDNDDQPLLETSAALYIIMTKALHIFHFNYFLLLKNFSKYFTLRQGCSEFILRGTTMR